MFRPSPTRQFLLQWSLPVSLLLLVPVLASEAASAQPYPAYRVYPEPVPQYRPRISPHEIEPIIRSLGLMPTSAPFPRGPFWVVDAVGQDGTPVRVRVDAMSGRVADIFRIPGPRMVRVYPGGPPPGVGYDGPVAGPRYGDVPVPVPPRGVGQPPQPGYYGDDDDDGYPMKDGPTYGPQTNPNYYDGPRGAVPPGGPNVITRDGGITNSIPQRQVSRGTGNDPLLGVPKEFRGEQKPKTEPKKTAAKPSEKTPEAAPLPKPRPADAPSVAKSETKSEVLSPSTAPQAKPEEKPATKGAPSAAKSATPPAQSFD